jgi:hypothetical protein
MKSTQRNLSPNKSIIHSALLGLIGFISWILIFLFFDPLAGLYKLGKWDLDMELLYYPKLYLQSLLVGLIFFLFFYFTLKNKESQGARMFMWTGIVIYTLFYLGYLFLLFFFRFSG